MGFLRNMAIRNKLISIIMLTCAGALLLAGCVFIVWEWHSLRRSMVQNLSTQAEMIADNCKAALAFEDAKDAEESLQSLRVQPAVLYASIHNSRDEHFAHYYRHDVGEGVHPPASQEEGHVFDSGTLTVFQGIILDGERIGTVSLRSDLSPMYAMLKRNAQTIFAVILGACLAAYFVSFRVQRIISVPILGLAEVAKTVSEEKDYAARALQQSNDEVGLLIKAFNEMLEQIQQRDSALVGAKEQLEERVTQRTTELTVANEQLTKEVTERKRAEEQTRVQKELLESTFESLTHPFYVIDVNDYSVKMANSAAAQFGFVPGQSTCYAVSHGQNKPCAKEQHQCPLEEVKKTKRPVTVEHVHYDKDGNEKHVEVHGYPIFDSEGNVVQMIEYCLDISERKRAEKELETANKRLVEASHKAGMAEVAADVLHNVGNVLNSINVSTTLISEKVSASKVTNLKKVADMIDEHIDDLGTFLTDNPQGKHIPAYLTKVTKLLVDDQADIAERLRPLAASVEHIKEVIAMQQSYAKASGVEVPMELAEVVENAIQINSAGLERHNVRLTREFAKLPQVNIDKQRVLQILVNLISNAKYALSESNNQERLITIRSYRSGEDRLRIEVIDNGVGLSKENLTKIFRHGFTTKSEGHGFGLHSGALAAKEIGGSLTVYSDGEGRGAKFTLELPYRPVGIVK